MGIDADGDEAFSRKTYWVITLVSWKLRKVTLNNSIAHGGIFRSRGGKGRLDVFWWRGHQAEFDGQHTWDCEMADCNDKQVGYP